MVIYHDLAELAEKLEIQIIIKKIEETRGGLCRLKNKLILFINDDLSVKENNQYQLSFAMDYPYMGGIIKRKNYSLLDLSVYKTTVSLFDTNFVILGKSNISSDEFLKVYDEYGKVLKQSKIFCINCLREDK